MQDGEWWYMILNWPSQDIVHCIRFVVGLSIAVQKTYLLIIEEIINSQIK